MGEPRAARLLGKHVHGQQRGERVAIGQIEIPDARGRNVQLVELGIAAEDAFLLTAPQHAIQDAQNGIGELGDAGRLLDVAALMEILAVQQADEFGMLEEIGPQESD